MRLLDYLLIHSQCNASVICRFDTSQYTSLAVIKSEIVVLKKNYGRLGKASQRILAVWFRLRMRGDEATCGMSVGGQPGD
jgi:hypothetical protein